MRIINSKIFILLIAGLFILKLPTFSQEKFTDKENFLEAEDYFEHEEFSDALPLYIQIKEKQPENYNLDYRIGRCYISIPGSKQKSVSYLENAVKRISAEYKEGKHTEFNAPVDAYYYLGVAYRVNNQLDKAIANFKIFKGKANPVTFDIKLVDDEIKACQNGIVAYKRPIDVDVENLGSVINTKYSETNPVVSPSEDFLVFSSKLPFYDAVFYSRKVNGKWITPINIMPELGVDDDCYPVCISDKGKELYFYRSDNYRGDLYVANFADGKWSKIRKLNSNINTKYWESHASISGDGKTLYFTSNREGSIGGLDIYKSERTTGDNWGPAVNLGPIVNSPYNEETPFVTSDGSRLYFSSFGHGTIGGYDIFYADKNPSGNWGKPKNIGYPMNTTDDDLFFCPVQDGSKGYMAVYDKNGAGRFDIERFYVYTHENPRKYNITATIIAPDGNKADRNMYVVLFDKAKKDTVLKQKVTNGNIAFQTIPGQYEVYVYSDNYQSLPDNLTIAWGSKDVDRKMNIALTKRQIVAQNEPTSNSLANATEIKENSQSGANAVDENGNQEKTTTTDDLSTAKDAGLSNNQQSVEGDTSSISTNNQGAGPVTSVIQTNASSNAETSFWFRNRWYLGASASIFPLILIVWLIIKRRKKNNK